jgi:hypothetical protein
MADEVDGGNVGREHRKADHGPLERVARQEIVAPFAAALSLAANKPGEDPQAYHCDEVKRNKRPVERADEFVHVFFKLRPLILN